MQDKPDANDSDRRSHMARVLGSVTASWRAVGAAFRRMTPPTPPYEGKLSVEPATEAGSKRSKAGRKDRGR
jgi:hypothetical protein